MAGEIVKDLGKVTAYAYAKAAGYTGTEEQFQQVFNEFTQNAPGLLDRLDDAVAGAEAAQTAAETAVTNANTAKNAAEAAQAAAQQTAQDMDDSVQQITTNKNDISDLRESLDASIEDTNNQIITYAYGTTINLKAFVQGDRLTSNPYVPTSDANRVTIQYPISVRKPDVLTITIPSGKKVGVVTDAGWKSGFRTNSLQYIADGTHDVFIIMANDDTTTPITPSDAEASGLTALIQDKTSRIATLETQVTKLEDNSEFFIEFSLMVTIPGYTVNDGRIYNTSSDTKRSDFVRVTSGTKIAYRLSGISAFNLISFYTDRNASSYQTGIGGQAAGTYTEGIFTVPSDGYVIFTSMNAYTDVYIGCVGGLYTIENRLDELENDSGIVDLAGKYILNFGDSLANGAGNNNQSYADMIASESGATLADYSVSGTPFANYGQTDSYACVYNQVRQAVIDHAADDVAICFVEGAINDLKRNVLDIGTLSDNYDGTYTQNMIIGTAEYIFYTLKTAFPSAKIIFVMYHHMPISTETLTESDMLTRQNTEHEAFKSVCQKWSIPIADVFAEGLLNSNIQAMANAYFGVNANEKFGRDIAHPTALGYRKFYVPLIKEKLSLSTFEV